MQITLTKQQEKVLMEIGLRALFRQEQSSTVRTVINVKPRKKAKRWTKQQHEKFRATMEKKYGRKFSK